MRCLTTVTNQIFLIPTVDNRLNTLLKKLVDVQDVVTQVTEEIKTLRNDYARANANDDDQNISINTKRVSEEIEASRL